ncbi:MAG: hypothetical protein C0502_01555 [Opitutus sp.]|nr:hypothetical protein [Opitutus sp.]
MPRRWQRLYPRPSGFPRLAQREISISLLPPMTRRFHACLAALSLVLCTSAAAADPPELVALMQSAQEVIAEGKLEHAHRIVARGLARAPGHAGLLEMQRRIDELYPREWGARAHGATPPPVAAAVVRPPTAAQVPATGRAFTLPGLDLTLLWIAPGEFLLESPHGNDDATPVTISRGFWLGRTEVTQEQWRALRPDNQNPALFKGSNRPVENVSWIETMEFIRVLNDRERAAGRLPAGYAYTLPTEAEWEYACRAGSSGPYAGEVARMAWHEANSGGQSRPVAQLAPNAWGLHDMHGNVAEWCLDGPAPYPGRPVIDPIQGFSGSAAPAVHILRGGGWNSRAGHCRSDMRSWRSLSLTSAAVGFRLALAPIRLPPATSAH